MGLRELLILVLILAIIGVVLRGLYVAMNARRNQIRVALERNIPDYDLEELELRELPSGGARMVERSFARVVEKNRQQDAREAAERRRHEAEQGGATLRKPVADWQNAQKSGPSGVRTLSRDTGEPVLAPAAVAAAATTVASSAVEPDSDDIPTLTERVEADVAPAPAATPPTHETTEPDETEVLDESFAEQSFGSPLQDDWSESAAPVEPVPEPEPEPKPELELDFEPALGQDLDEEPEPEPQSAPQEDHEPAATEAPETPFIELEELDEATEEQVAAELRALAREAVTPATRDEDYHDSLDAQVYVDDYSPDDDDEDYDDDMDPEDDDHDDHDDELDEALTQSSWLDDLPDEEPAQPTRESAPALDEASSLADTEFTDEAQETDSMPGDLPSRDAEPALDEAAPDEREPELFEPEFTPEPEPGERTLVADSDEEEMVTREADEQEPTYYYYSGGPYYREPASTGAEPEQEPAYADAMEDDYPDEDVWDQSELEPEQQGGPELEPELESGPELDSEPVMALDAERDLDDIDVLLDGYEDERSERLEALQAQQEKASSRLMAWAGATMGKAGSLLRGRRDRAADEAEAKAERRAERKRRKAQEAELAARQQELALDDPPSAAPDELLDEPDFDAYPTAEAAPPAAEELAPEDAAEATPARDMEYSEVLVVNVMAREGEDISGEELLPVLMAYGLRFGEMNIFHRHAGGKQGPVVFSVANILNPGTFDLNQISDFTTKGLCFFVTLPSVIDNMKAFDQMLAIAAHVAEELDAELKDDYRSVMTAQTVEHYREQVRNFELRQMRRGR